MTIDCNIHNQPIPDGYRWAPVIVGAIGLAGSQIRARRVRAIHFGSQGTIAPIPECFPIYVTNGHPDHPSNFNCVIEDCIIEKPGENTTYTNTCLGLLAGEAQGRNGYHLACAIRNCYLDGDFSKDALPIQSITAAQQGSDWYATVTTSVPHDRYANHWVIIRGARANGQQMTTGANPRPYFDGSYQVTERVSDTVFKYKLTGDPGVSAAFGEMWVNKFSSLPVAVASIAKTGTLVTITTATPHNRTAEHNVTVFNVIVPDGELNYYNGSFPIEGILSPTVLTYRLSATPPYDPTGSVFITGGFHGLSADNGSAAVAEGNAILNCYIGGPYHDTYPTRDLTVRNNFYRNVTIGPYQNLNGKSFTPLAGTISHIGNVATFSTAPTVHNIRFGQRVEITGAAEAVFNGEFKVTAVTPTTFSYELPSAPPQPAGGSPQVRVFFETENLIIEDNVIELAHNIHPAGWGPPSGIVVAGGIPPRRVFPKVFVRGNFVRLIDGEPDPWAWGVDILGCENGRVESNLVELTGFYRVVDRHSTNVTYFNNRDAANALTRGRDGITNVLREEVETQIDDALVAAFLNIL